MNNIPSGSSGQQYEYEKIGARVPTLVMHGFFDW